MQYTEREHSKQKGLYFIYFTCYKVELILKIVRNLFQTFHLDGSIWFRYQMIVRSNLKTASCPLRSDRPPKSSRRSTLSLPAYFSGSQCLATTLHTVCSLKKLWKFENFVALYTCTSVSFLLETIVLISRSGWFVNSRDIFNTLLRRMGELIN